MMKLQCFIYVNPLNINVEHLLLYHYQTWIDFYQINQKSIVFYYVLTCIQKQVYIDVICFSGIQKETNICSVKSLTAIYEFLIKKKYDVDILLKIQDLEMFKVICTNNLVHDIYIQSKDWVYIVPKVQIEEVTDFLPNELFYKIQLKKKSKNWYCITYDSTKIIQDTTLSDQDTLTWLKRYSQNFVPIELDLRDSSKKFITTYNMAKPETMRYSS